jgi:RimJ/RimL family protein N-acetyltransferase
VDPAVLLTPSTRSLETRRELRATMTIRLVPMTASEYDSFMENLIREYAADHVRTGQWTAEEGPAKAREETRELLPEGVATPNHYLFTIVGDPTGEKLGAIWLAVEPRGGFIYDLLILEPYRRRGYAEEAMHRIEDVAREKGVSKISLHVFGDNLGARKLYAKLGYAETNVVMAKSLSG